MNTKTALITAALGGLFALGALTATAADDASTEKCYGVAKAGDANEWVKVPAGTCERLVGGSLAPAKK